MKNLSRYFLRGVFTLLPFGLTIYVLVLFLGWTDNLARSLLKVFASELYFPGLGLLIGLFLVCLLGFLTTQRFMQGLFLVLELPFKNVPIVKSIYSAVKNLSDYFSSEGGNGEQQVVLVRIPNSPVELVGLVTRSHLRDLPDQFTKEDRIAVFMPLSYQIGGLTVFIPRGWVQKVDMPVEVAMRSALTAWMPGREKNP